MYFFRIVTYIRGFFSCFVSAGIIRQRLVLLVLSPCSRKGIKSSLDFIPSCAIYVPVLFGYPLINGSNLWFQLLIDPTAVLLAVFLQKSHIKGLQLL